MARRTLEREGHTLSWAIRTMVEYIARTGSVPQLVADEDDAVKTARETTDFFESLPLREPPVGWGDVALDRQLIDDEREARLGEKTYIAH